MTSYEIIDRLAERHARDVFVRECKDGPTYTGSHLRLDAWAMNRSWSKHCTFGYEVKVSRSDFIRDDKMRYYLPMCHEFYVVCPAGIVESMDELPQGAGLMIASPNHHRLVTKKKAQYREIPDPVLVYRYILMARAHIDPHNYYMPEGREIFWTRWLERKEINHDLGSHVSKTIGKLIRERIENVETQNEYLKRENAGYAEIKAMLKELGITHFRGSTWGVREKLEAYKKGFPGDLKRTLQQSRQHAAELVNLANAIEKALG